MLEHDVDAAPVRESQDFGGDVLLVMVDDLVAPSARARSSFSSEPAVANTRAPCSTAIWIAAWPTPLPAASTSTSSPRCQPRARHEHVPGGEKRQRKRGRADEVDRVGNRESTF